MIEEEMILEESLSARRAWIEIGNSCTQAEPEKVALRKESVDRNCSVRCYPSGYRWSLSARRAWIEILIILCPKSAPYVALRKESVDRKINQKENTRKTVFVALRKESVDRNA